MVVLYFSAINYFTLGRFIALTMLRETVQAINVVFRNEITWPSRQRCVDSQLAFKVLCGMPGVVGAINGTHIHIAKPGVGPEDYYYFKSGGYTINCHAVVDSSKRFLDLYLVMLGSIINLRVLDRSTLYQ